MKISFFAAFMLLAGACLSAFPTFAKNSDGKSITGIASFYWQDQKTANGETFNKYDLTAAHRTLPFGTLVRVTRLKTGKQVVVRINDRGPFIKGRIIDLSLAAAQKLA